MPDAPTLRGSRLVLRPPMSRDYGERFALGRDPEIVRMFGGAWDGAQALTPNDVATWFAEIEGSPTAWVVEHDNRFLGSVRLHHVQPGTRARLAIGLFDPTKLGRGNIMVRKLSDLFWSTHSTRSDCAELIYAFWNITSALFVAI